ncbi:major tail protein (plasmid) [Clostridium perfringens]
MGVDKKKILKGFAEIHFAPFRDNEFQTPIAIDNAKSIKSELNYESESIWAEDQIVDNDLNYAGGEGTLGVLGLSAKDLNTLYNNKLVKGGVLVKSDDEAPDGAFLFSRKKKNGHKRLYVIYACKCSPTGINAEGIEDGKGDPSVEEVKFTVGQLENKNIYFFIDTDDSTVDQEQVTNWFKEVQEPIELGRSKELKTQEVSEEKETKGKGK